ncbi:hypothetical protein BTS2_2957 [Bacillus sp. TS-2]|nr:hypothetical protein BTS2_2957 [Bacillus sp. TS-2]
MQKQCCFIAHLYYKIILPNEPGIYFTLLSLFEPFRRSQISPENFDKGTYSVSEFTFYRILGEKS